MQTDNVTIKDAVRVMRREHAKRPLDVTRFDFVGRAVGSHCTKCGRKFVADGVTPGYATQLDDRRVCYPCADEMQRATMRRADKVPAYLGGDGKVITTWTGGVLARVTSENSSRTGWGRSSIVHVRAIDADGTKWYGKGAGRGMFITLNRAKAKRVA